MIDYTRIRDFKINDFLTIKLEGGKTVIYVKNRPFRQCMYLLLDIPVDRVEKYDEIRSIDEAAVKLSRKMEQNHRLVPPETEFWGHCSNLQAWFDNDYDTRILHRNLAFPLLKALCDAGDMIARRKFKEEIAMRYATGHPTVVRFLTQNGYLHYLTEDEFESILIDIDFPNIKEFSRKISTQLKTYDDPESEKEIKLQVTKFMHTFRLSYKYLLLIKSIENIPNDLKQPFVEIIYNRYKNNRSFPILKFLNKALVNYENLDIKLLTYKDKLIGILQDNFLNLRNKMIEDVLEIKGLEEIESKIDHLDLGNNRITKIEGLDRLENLKKLDLKNNYIEKIEGIEELKNLELLDLSGNINIKVIPENLNELPFLKVVKLTGCRIGTITDSALKYLWMGQNFRYYTDYTDEEVQYYEKNYSSRARANNRLYKNFVKWLLKVRTQMVDLSFDFKDIKKYELKNSKNALRAWNPTRSFIKYLDDKKQLRITKFLGIT
ncbi:MAG: leucine-rich repeat domain-containing protein [Candidatus Lokiarchaeota archaeon]|nr:leucine-rich repeat domain-containing protein [Candidatus Lokiarchaeota archaeon]